MAGFAEDEAAGVVGTEAGDDTVEGRGEFGRGDEIEVDVSEDKERLVFRALTGQQA